MTTHLPYLSNNRHYHLVGRTNGGIVKDQLADVMIQKQHLMAINPRVARNIQSLGIMDEIIGTTGG